MSHSHAHHIDKHGRSRTAFAIGTCLNIALVVAEAVWGVLANSTALLADAGHNLGDVLGLGLAWGAVILAQRKPTQRFTYGLRGTSILAALFNAVLVLIAVGAIGWEAILRIGVPQHVNTTTVMIVAGVGVVINGLTAWLFMANREHDINVRGAYVHMLSDCGISLGVVAAGAVTLFTGWLWIDPATSLVIAAIITVGTWGLLRESFALALDAVPEGVDAVAVRRYFVQLPGVVSVHDLHIWPMSTTEVALTVHLIMPDGHPGDGFLLETCKALRSLFDIAHPTLQIEVGIDTQCALAPEHVV